MLKLITNPGKFYQDHFYKTSGLMIGIIWAVVFLVATVASSAVGIAFNSSNWFLQTIFAIGSSLVSVAVFATIFAFSVKYIAGADKKEFKLIHAFKLFLTGHLVANLIPSILSVIIVPLAFITANSAFVTTDISQLGIQDYDQVMSLTTQATIYGVMGILTACMSIAGMIWGFVVEFIGTKKLTGASDGKAFIAVAVAYGAQFMVALVLGAIMGLITAAVIGSTSVGYYVG